MNTSATAGSFSSRELTPQERIRLEVHARKIVSECCAVAAGESVAVLIDSPQPMIIATALLEAAMAAGACGTIVAVPAMQTPGADLPEMAGAALAASDVVLAPTSKTAYYTPLIQKLCRQEKKARFLALSEASEDTILNGGIEADFVTLAPIAETVARLFTHAHEVVLSTPGGTELRAEIGGRPGGWVGGLCQERGAMSALPDVEAWCVPIEASVCGRVVVDLSGSAGIGIIGDEPIMFDVVDGKATNISGGSQAKLLEAELQRADASSAFQLAEIAVGLNPRCRITGRIIEDEGKYGTCHVALGSNIFLGGSSDAPLHVDLVQAEPSLIVDGTPVMQDGRLCDPQLRGVVEARASGISCQP